MKTPSEPEKDIGRRPLVITLLFSTVVLLNTISSAQAETLAAGGSHSLSINDPGSIWGWGENRDHQLGTDDTIARPTAVKLSVNETWAMVSAGAEHTVAVRADGTLWGTGSNETGQLGLGATTEATTLTQIGADNDWMAVSAGNYHTLALKTDNTLWAFGSNVSGQLGDESFTTSTTPIPIDAGNTYMAIAAGAFHSLAIRSDGTLWSWGNNLSSALGLGEDMAGTLYVQEPTQVGSASNWDMIAAGGTHSLAVNDNGELWAWGRNAEGQLGAGPLTTPRMSPVRIGSASDWIAIAAGDKHSLGIRGAAGEGSLWAMGLNFSGQLGTGGNANQFQPTQIGTATNWTSVAGGNRHSLAVNSSGEVFASGSNEKGQLGSLSVVGQSQMFVGPLNFEDTGVSDPRPDFTITNIEFPNNSTYQLTLGQTLDIDFRLTNIGADYPLDGTPILIDIIRADTPVDDVLATFQFNGSLDQDESAIFSISVTIPQGTPTGSQIIGIVADAGENITEADESNNRIVGDGVDLFQFEVYDNPDFSIVSAVASPEELRPGASIDFDITVLNSAGLYPSVSTDVPIRVIMTNNMIIGDGDDVFLGTTFLRDGLGTDEEAVVSASFTHPSGINVGGYHYAFQINASGSIDETDLDNNTLVSDPPLFAYNADYLISNATLDSTELLPGDAMDFTVTVQNIGAAVQADQFDVELQAVLTIDQEIGNADDIAIGTVTFSDAIAFGQSIFVVDSLALPDSVPPGDYSVGFTVNSDGVLPEIDETNNDFVGTQVLSLFPDLVLDVFSVPPGVEFVRDSDIGFKVTVRNQGSDYVAGLNPPFTVDIRLTQNMVLGDGDDVILLAATTPIQHVGDLGSGEIFQDNELYSVPDIVANGGSLPAGTYFLAARVDPPLPPMGMDVVPELDDLSNNVKFQGPYDLFADLTVDPLVNGVEFTGGNFDRGDPVTISEVTVNNISQFDLVEDVSIQVRLSRNKTWGDIDDVVLIEEETFAGLDALDSVILGALAPTIPDDAPAGSYYLAVRVDYNNEVSESVESNNTRFSDFRDVVINGVDLGAALEDHLDPRDNINVFQFDRKYGLDPDLGGNMEWFAQDNMADNGDGGQSGAISDGEESYFELNLFVPGEVSFDFSFFWKVSSEPGFDTLSFSINDEVVESISGEVGFTEVSQTLSPGAYTFRWTYSKDDSVTEGMDAGWVDSITISESATPSLPDLVVNSVVYEAGTRVLQLDTLDLNVQGQNRGSAAGIQNLPDEFVVEVYLSPDPDFDELEDPFVGELTMLRDLDVNAIFNFQGELEIPTTLFPGDYHLVVLVDATDIVEEGNELNNAFVSDTADITIEARPDLRPTSLEYDSGFFLYGDTLTLDFTIANDGLTRVEDPFTAKVVLSNDRVFDASTDYVLTEVNFTGIISAGQSRSFASTVQVEDQIPIGEFQYIGIVVDSEGEVAESGETNNVLGSNDDDLFFAAVSLEEALDLDDAAGAAGAAGSFQLNNDLSAPFYGQLTETFDTVDGAQSAVIGHNGTASFEITVIPQNRTVVSFQWSVSSELNETTGKEDALKFYIDDTEMASISGEIAWNEVSFVLEAGEHTLKWSYEKDGSISEGEDAGFVDSLSLIVPDLVVSNLEFPAGAYTPGQTVSGVAFDVENQGIADVPATPPYTIRIYLSQDDTIDGADFIVDQFTRTDGLASGSTLSIERDITVPTSLAFAGNYYLIVDVDTADVIPEADETNNEIASDPADFEVTLDISLEDALDLVGADWTTGGDGVWFPQADRELSDLTHSTDDGVDAAESPSLGFNQSSYLEIELQGPVILDFSWKISAEPTLKELTLYVNDVEKMSINGNVDWTDESIFIPTGTQIVRWELSSLTSTVTGEDKAWLDNVSLAAVTDPELVITRLDVTEGEYVLDRTIVDGLENSTLGTQYLEIIVEAENQGTILEDVGAGFFTVSDIEVRLSLDPIYGNDDDILLGEFARVEEEFEGAQQVKFIGPISLGDHIPEDNYYVLAKIDPLDDITEVDETNNVASTGSASVQITRLPNLEIYKSKVVIDENKQYYTQDPIQFDFVINNDGLDLIPGNVEWDVSIGLRAVSKENLQNLADTFDDEGTLPENDAAFAGSTLGPLPLQTFTEKQLMFGRSDGDEDGDEIAISVFANLPQFDRLETLIGEGESVEDYLYFFEVNLDSEDVIRESDELRSLVFLRTDDIILGFSVNLAQPQRLDNDLAFGIKFNPGSLDSSEWKGLYNVTDSMFVDTDGDGLNNNLEYALNRNPFVDDASAELLGSFGRTEVAEDDYLSLTFDILRRASDLEYAVQADTDMAFDDGDLVVLTPPYTDSVGAGSLNGDNGVVLTNALVLAAVENGYSARITVRDSETMADAPVRFMRLVITDTNGYDPAFTSSPVTAASVGVPYTYNIVAQDDDNSTLTITAPTQPGWLDFTDNGNGSATLSQTPGGGDVGPHDVTLQVTDDDGNVIEQSFTITVSP